MVCLRGWSAVSKWRFPISIMMAAITLMKCSWEWQTPINKKWRENKFYEICMWVHPFYSSFVKLTCKLISAFYNTIFLWLKSSVWLVCLQGTIVTSAKHLASSVSVNLSVLPTFTNFYRMSTSKLSKWKNIYSFCTPLSNLFLFCYDFSLALACAETWLYIRFYFVISFYAFHFPYGLFFKECYV